MRSIVHFGPAMCVAVGAAAIPQAYAQITVSPMNIDARLEQGKPLPTIKVTNGSNEPYTFEVSVVPAMHDPAGVPIEAPKTYKYGAESILSLTKKSFQLKAGESTNLDVKAKLPRGTTGKSAHALIWVLGIPESAKVAKTFASHLRMGVTVSLVLPGAAAQAYRLGKVDAVQEQNGDVRFYVPARNTGSTVIRVGGTVIIQDDKGKELAKLPLETAPVFPEMIRHVRATWKGGAKGLAKGECKLAATAEVEGQPSQTILGSLTVLGPGTLAQQKASVVKMPLMATVTGRPIQLEATVANLGNVPFNGTGRVTFVKAPAQETVSLAQLSPTAPIATGGRGVLQGSVAQGLKPGSYQVRLEVLNANDFVVARWAGTLEVAEKEIKVAGQIKRISGPSAKEPVVTVEFQNDSNVPLETEGAVLVVDSSGNTVGTIPLAKRRTEPGRVQLYQDKLPELDSGLYELRATVNYAGQKTTATAKHFVQ